MLRGLRGRLAAALGLISVVTLAIAALALLGPLDARLRNDEIETLAATGRDTKDQLQRLPSNAFNARDPRLGRALRTVRQRSLGDVAIVTETGSILATTDPDARERFPDGVVAARTGRSSSGSEGKGAESEARAALALETGTRRYGIALRRPLDDAAEAAVVVRKAFVTAAAVSLLVALLLGFLLSGGLARRLRALRDSALRVAEIGPVAEITPDATRDEVGDLTRAFTEMQQRLREQEQARKSFVATASHELRTPLSSLLLMLDLLRGDLDADPADVADARIQAARAEAQAVRLSALSGELLDLSRIDAKVPLRHEPVELGEVAAMIAAEFAVRADAAGVAIEVEAAESAWAAGDPGAVAQIGRILADNGLRHTPPGTALTLRATSEAGGATVALIVADAGVGVPEVDRARIFQRFERGGVDPAGGGSGLGLAIGRELARQMGGDLVLDEKAAGATFSLRLPSAP